MTEAYDRLTVNLIDRASRALELLHQVTGLSKTDCVNRALQVYSLIEYEISCGAEFIVRKDGEYQVIRLGAGEQEEEGSRG